MKNWTRRHLKRSVPKRRIHRRFPLVARSMWNRCAWYMRDRLLRRLSRVEGRVGRYARMQERIRGGMYEGPGLLHYPTRPLLGRQIGRWRRATLRWWAEQFIGMAP